MNTYATDHYIFHYEPGSRAELDIGFIADGQEGCFRHITSCLGVCPPEKIHYYLYNSREEVAQEVERRFGEYMLTNGCAVSENEILAVYNDEIQCIGFHEDTHVISYQLDMPKADFLTEGLACCMDQVWWGVSNNAWAAYYLEKGACPSIVQLFTNEEFYQLSDVVTYPIAGAFVQYLMLRFGPESFKRFYISQSEDFSSTAETIFGWTLETLEKEFWMYIKLLRFEKGVYNLIDALLKEYC